jgi:hypothetical protein
MEDKLIEDLQVELSRVVELPLEEQPEAFAAIRDQLEIALDAPVTE